MSLEWDVTLDARPTRVWYFLMFYFLARLSPVLSACFVRQLWRDW